MAVSDKVTLLDLNAAQTAAVEAAVGITAQRMGNDPEVSVMDILREILVASGRKTVDEAAAMTNREVMAQASIDDEPAPKAGKPRQRPAKLTE